MSGKQKLRKLQDARLNHVRGMEDVYFHSATLWKAIKGDDRELEEKEEAKHKEFQHACDIATKRYWRLRDQYPSLAHQLDKEVEREKEINRLLEKVASTPEIPAY